MPYGKIDCFDLSSRKWTKYVSRVKQFIALNEIKDSLHVATLITVVGEPTYDLMCDLCAPNKPETKTFTELVSIVEQHLEPRRSDIAERHIFRLRRQKAGEELSLYLQTLKHLASTCNFAEKLEENLRDQFVSGLAGDEMRSRLFAEKDLDYKRAVELALALEAAERHAETSGSASAQGAASALVGAPEPPVHRIGGGGGASAAHQARGSNQKCWRCGRQHPPDNCRYRRYNCDECGVRGHLKAMCKSARSSGDSAGDRSVGAGEKREARDLPLYVIREGGPPLLGRSWLRHLKLKNIEIQMNNIGCDMSCSKTD
ncbi:polyprotein, partial [Operophtera brumata]